MSELKFAYVFAPMLEVYPKQGSSDCQVTYKQGSGLELDFILTEEQMDPDRGIVQTIGKLVACGRGSTEEVYDMLTRNEIKVLKVGNRERHQLFNEGRALRDK